MASPLSGPMPEPTRPRRRLWWLALPLILLLAAALAWMLLRGTPVEVHRVQAAPLVQSLAVSGRVASETRVFLGATITGRIAEVTKREGATLRAGELLVRLEEAELAATARQAEAALRAAEARLAGQRELAAPVAVQQLEQARANAEAAERERTRSEQLFAQGFVGQARVDEARRAAEVAQAALRAAQAQRTANVGGTETLQVQARVAEARAALDLARARLAQTRITAPADATLLARLAEPGQIVQPGTRLAELGVQGPVQLIALVDEKYVGQLAPGQVATAIADAYPQQAFEARIATLAPLVDAQRGSVEVKFALPAPPPQLKNDMTVSIEIVTGRRDKALALPTEALRAGPAVLRVRDGRAELQPVRLGLRTLSAVEVLEGLQPGDEVVLDARVLPGARVRAQAAKPRAAVVGAGVTDAVRGFGRD